MRKAVVLFLLVLVGFGTVRAHEPSILKSKKIRHLVLLKFKEGTTPDQIARIDTLVWKLTKEIKVVHDVEWGKSLQQTNETQAYDYCLSIIFKSKTDMLLYDEHPFHQKLEAALLPLVSKITRFNYKIE